MNFLEEMTKKAKANKRSIVLPESMDKRTLEATETLLKEGIANIILIGDEDAIKAEATGFDISGATIINPTKYEKLDELTDKLVEIRKNKGMTKDEARELLTSQVLYFGVMLVKEGIADGMVAGAAHNTADVLRPCLQIIKTAKDSKIVSSFFVMDVPDCEYGNNGLFIFSDSAIVQNPNSEELASIAISSANSYKAIFGGDPSVAMLSHSTMGSAKHSDIDKVIEATKIVKQLAPELKVDGELQLDAAIVPKVGKSKAPNSDVAGNANVLIFPDLDAANIGYKLVERLAKAKAHGPVIQGLAKPVNDLSRGCSAADIVSVTTITAVQANG